MRDTAAPSEEELDRLDAAFLAALEAALAGGRGRAAGRLACRPGCTRCCLGPFPVNAADARRLARGLAALARTDPPRAARVAARARDSAARLGAAPGFPGDPVTGALTDDEEARVGFCSAHIAEPCPCLDPAAGTCDLYAHRAVACRTFGPPVEILGEPLEPCGLCFVGASPVEVDAARVVVDPDGLEVPLLERLGDGETFIAFALSERGTGAVGAGSTIRSAGPGARIR